MKTHFVTRNKNNMTGDTCEAETLPPYTFYCVRVAEFLVFCIAFCGSLFIVRSLVFCVVLCKSLSVLLSLSFVHCVIYSSSHNGFRMSPFDILKYLFDINNSIRCLFVDFMVINVIRHFAFIV